MSKIEKLIARFKTKPKDFAWDEMTKILNHFGYEEIHGSVMNVNYNYRPTTIKITDLT